MTKARQIKFFLLDESFNTLLQKLIEIYVEITFITTVKSGVRLLSLQSKGYKDTGCNTSGGKAKYKREKEQNTK